HPTEDVARPTGAQQPAGEKPKQEEKPKLPQPRPLPQRLQIPPDLPRAQAPPIILPPASAPRKEKAAAIEQLYPPLPPLGPEPKPAPGPEGRALTLADLQQLAMTNSPVLRQAAADVEAARGAAVQAGTHPNPTVGYEVDQWNSGRTTGQQGGFVEQLIKTA